MSLSHGQKLKPSLLDMTLEQAAKDSQTVTADGTPTATLLDGMSFRELPTHSDERGTVVELFDPRWNWHPDPLLFTYSFTIRPGFAKGWNLHKLHEDRYFILQGELELMLYDVRPRLPHVWANLPRRTFGAQSPASQRAQVCLARGSQYWLARCRRHQFSHYGLRSRQS